MSRVHSAKVQRVQSSNVGHRELQMMKRQGILIELGQDRFRVTLKLPNLGFQMSRIHSAKVQRVQSSRVGHRQVQMMKRQGAVTQLGQNSLRSGIARVD
jgi:protein-tyrosine-phosphatase